ncbi:isocitrate lyase/PEP mutase family protein [Thiohalocapsa marina]|uniref:Isocitrate lyase/PEP mutase family protein n=2 Tax=Thiohalocapsa marina TaxID=424902 RepID=A0A5M8FM22_9GAMM|nr:isocitrate lyase/PEP mutase family protein [Thiohalocapsa marina]
MTPAQQLRKVLQPAGCRVMPCCFDALSARLVEHAGFPLTFMSGFAVSAARAALPDTGLLSVSEMLDQGRSICDAVSIPVIGDGDTGHGNPANVRRTVTQYARAGFAGIMLEDQLAPKRCGHTGVKEVVSRTEALRRIRAAVDARDAGADLVIVARTDARSALEAVHGPRRALDEAIWRLQAFADLGAEVLFLEAPRSEAEMARICREVPGLRMANMLEEGITPVLPPTRLAEIGFRIAAYPLTLLSCAVHAMQAALQQLQLGQTPAARVDFATLRGIVGFDAYDALLDQYRHEDAPSNCDQSDVDQDASQ